MNLVKKAYDWVISWASTPYALYALILLSFTESFFFPIPPDILLIAIAFSKPRHSFFYATLCSLSSVVGGIVGYIIGYFLFESIGKLIFDLYGGINQFETVKEYYNSKGAWMVLIGGFTPVPYKLVTIASGAFLMDFKIFLICSVISRSARFFLESLLIFFFGEKIRLLLEKYFNLFTILLIMTVILGFLLFRVLF
ncbi:MAG: YqaA family protein [Nitrospinota bacterium]|nr:YqaA family protein [Nitrospinota bacterium]